MPQSFSIAETGWKSAPFRGGDLRALLRPLSARLPSGLRFLQHPLPPGPSPFLTVGLPPVGAVRGAYPIDRVEAADGRLGPVARRGFDEHRRVRWVDPDLPAYPFGSCLSASLAGSASRAVTTVLRLRSADPPSPSPAPDVRLSGPDRCPRGVAPGITPQHARVGAPGCDRVQRGEPASRLALQI